MAIELATGWRNRARRDYASAAVFPRHTRSPGRKPRRAEKELDGRSGRCKNRVHVAGEVCGANGLARSEFSSFALDARISRRRCSACLQAVAVTYHRSFDQRTSPRVRIRDSIIPNTDSHSATDCRPSHTNCLFSADYFCGKRWHEDWLSTLPPLTTGG